jgi:hypothetical protein
MGNACGYMNILTLHNKTASKLHYALEVQKEI